MTQLYLSKGYVEIDGVPVIRSSMIDVQQSTQITDVDTIIDAAGGFAQGTVKYDVSLESPVPAEGYEIDFLAVAEAGEIHDLAFVLLKPAGGVLARLPLRGVFMDPGVGVGANKAVDAKVKFRGMRPPEAP